MTCLHGLSNGCIGKFQGNCLSQHSCANLLRCTVQHGDCPDSVTQLPQRVGLLSVYFIPFLWETVTQRGGRWLECVFYHIMRASWSVNIVLGLYVCTSEREKGVKQWV